MSLASLPTDPTGADIVARSCLLHPSLYAEALNARASELRAAARTAPGAPDTLDTPAAQLRGQASRIELAADLMHERTTTVEPEPCAVEIVRSPKARRTAYGRAAIADIIAIAARLQCLPPSLYAPTITAACAA